MRLSKVSLPQGSGLRFWPDTYPMANSSSSARWLSILCTVLGPLLEAHLPTTQSRIPDETRQSHSSRLQGGEVWQRPRQVRAGTPPLSSPQYARQSTLYVNIFYLRIPHYTVPVTVKKCNHKNCCFFMAPALLNGSNVRLNWNIESDVNVYWIKFKNFLSLYWFKNKQHWI